MSDCVEFCFPLPDRRDKLSPPYTFNNLVDTSIPSHFNSGRMLHVLPCIMLISLLNNIPVHDEGCIWFKFQNPVDEILASVCYLGPLHLGCCACCEEGFNSHNGLETLFFFYFLLLTSRQKAVA